MGYKKSKGPKKAGKAGTGKHVKIKNKALITDSTQLKPDLNYSSATTFDFNKPIEDIDD